MGQARKCQRGVAAGRIAVATLWFVVGPPGGKIEVGPRPHDAVVGGLFRGGVPADVERAGRGARQDQARHGRGIGSRLRRGLSGGFGRRLRCRLRCRFLCRLGRGFRRRLGRTGDRDGGLVGPRAGLVPVSTVAGPHHHLVLGPVGQSVHRVGRFRGVFIAAFGGVVVPVRQEFLVRGRPGYPVVGGSIAGRVPVDDQLSGVGAGEAQVLYFARFRAGPDGPLAKEDKPGDQRRDQRQQKGKGDSAGMSPVPSSGCSVRMLGRVIGSGF